MAILKSVCVYCGSYSGRRAEYALAAQELGSLLASTGRTLVYGGGSIGLMGETARAAHAAGGRVIGVIPGHLNTKERAYVEVELRVVESMHARKQTLADLADGFVALPGGLGTFDELFEVWSWRHLGYHDQPIGLLDTAGYFQPLMALLHHAVDAGFVTSDQLDMVIVDTHPDALLDAIEQQARHASAPDDLRRI
jgi:hypothetical protein